MNYLYYTRNISLTDKKEFYKDKIDVWFYD